MHIIFEEHSYKAEVVKDVLKDIGAMQDVDKNINITYVGYFYSETVKDCVFILPKVLLKDIKNEDGKTIEVLADIEPRDNESGTKKYITPEDIISPEGQKKYLTDEYSKFIYEFAVWIFRALSIYRQKKPNSHAIYYKQLPQSGRGKRHQANTFLDILLSLIRFNKENQDFFMFTIRNMHSGLNKINWTKTISKSQALIQDETPVYLDPVNKKHQINFDEELFIIFFSILRHINDKYGFQAPVNFQYELISKKRFEHYLNGYGQLRLRQIKYKYFSDRALALWDLCYAFFESTHQLAVNTDQKEYLLAKKFENVFESMIDELIGDSDIPRGLKEQYDGKRVDHMYRYDALIRDDNEQTDEQIYYIGDSKYYKSGHTLGKNSIYKQFTYARNVVQWNLDLFLDEEIATRDMTDDEKADYIADKHTDCYKSIRLRKDGIGFSTEGYNVIPNFFISAFVYPDRKYVATKNVRPSGNAERPHTHISFQFENRLFDRDTLILSHYDVNFLYVVYLYARNKQAEKATWRKQVRDIFRDEIRKVIEDKFDFFAMKAYHEDDANDFLRTHFQEVNGKIYTPYGVDNIYSLALTHEENKDSDIYKENLALREQLSNYFAIVPLAKSTDEIGQLKLGENPEAILQNMVIAGRKQQATDYIQPQWLTEHHLERYPNSGVTIGFYRNEQHLRWILGDNNRGTLIYNVRAHRVKDLKEGEVRQGSHTENWYNKQKTMFVILYTDGYEKTGKYRVFHVKDHAYLEKKDVLETKYPTKNPNGQPESDYYLYRFDEEVSIGKIDIVRLIDELSSQAIFSTEGYVQNQPLFITAQDLIRYRK